MESVPLPLKYSNTGTGAKPIFHIAAELSTSDVGDRIRKKVLEFQKAGTESAENLFSELCFCILTANTSAEMGIRTIESIGLENLLTASQEELRDLLKKNRYRFYNLRSKFIVSARWVIDELPGLIRGPDHSGSREYLVNNIMGIGYKEASHFMRNVGIFDFAILDKHILRIMSQEMPGIKLKPTSRKRYLEIEAAFIEKSLELGLKPGILDLYLWYLATGKILK
ncbi:MAG: N-glycosylase/DNA lyase [Thermoplasmataceae archaeon]